MFYGLVCLTWLDTISVVGTVLTIVLVELLKATWNAEKINEEVFNATLDTSKSKPTRPISAPVLIKDPQTTTATSSPTTLRKISLNGQLKIKKCDFKEDSLSCTSSTPPITVATPTTLITTSSAELPSTPPTPHHVNTLQRHSLSSLSNGSHHNISISHPSLLSSGESLLSDEYHEDEDTLSLDNLFPCDQSEIYASKKISFIIDELIQTEMSYVSNLKKGLQNYGSLQKQRENLPETLQGVEKQQQLLGNIDEILELHEQKILPMMLRHQRDLKALFDEFAAHFDKDHFYPYVIFMMNKKTSMQLRQEQREWFQAYQTEIKDKLGIDSFLVQPIQRLTRYPLLLQQFISEFYKSGISCKPVLMSVCKLETRMRRTLEVVNHAEEIPSIEDIHELNVMQQGHFRRSTEFDAYNYRSRKKYRLRVLLFDRCLACVEVRKKRLVYRQNFPWENIELKLGNSKSITILLKPAGSTKPTLGEEDVKDAAEHSATTNSSNTTTSNNTSTNLNNATTTTTTSTTSTIQNGREELELSAPEAISVTQWLKSARRIIEIARIEAAQRARFSLPMDLVLGVAFAVWLIWKYLY